MNMFAIMLYKIEFFQVSLNMKVYKYLIRFQMVFRSQKQSVISLQFSKIMFEKITFIFLNFNKQLIGNLYQYVIDYILATLFLTCY